MNLPNAAFSVVEREKITGSLLSPAHPDNGVELFAPRSGWVGL